MIPVSLAEGFPIGGPGNCEQKLELALHKILRSQGVPPFATNANELIAWAVDPDGSSTELTRVILKDLGLTSQVLRTANSSLYNRSGKSILNMAHAVALLGWETICNLVSALRFIDHFSAHSPGLRELMMAALMTATHGREVAKSIGYPRPEEAYICSLFRNMGEVLVARYYPREYSRIVVAVERENLSERVACIRVLGFTWDEMAGRLAGSWNLPRQISLCFAPPGPVALPNAFDRSLASIASYGQALTAALYRNSTRLDAVRLNPVIDLKGNPHLVSPRTLHRIVNSALDDTKETFTALRIPINTLQLERQVEAAQAMLESVTAVEDDLEVSPSPDLAAASSTAATDSNLTSIIVACLESLIRCGFHRALFALLNEQRDLLRGRLGAGVDIDATLARFVFPMTKPDEIMKAVLLRRQDLLVDCAVDKSYSQSGLGVAFHPAMFALYPVIVDNLVIGCVYADVVQPAEAIRHNISPQLREARNGIAAALEKTRAMTSHAIAEF